MATSRPEVASLENLPDSARPSERDGLERRRIEHQRQRYVRWFLQLVGLVTLLAFAAGLMPPVWFPWIADQLGINDFPEHPLSYYLARHLSLLYGFVGVALLVIAADLPRYQPLVAKLGMGTIAFGGLQLIVDAWVGMPLWWTLYEGLSTILGGAIILILARWLPATDP